MKLWVVTHVWRGLVNKVWLFKYKSVAERFYEKLKSKIPTDVDDVSLDHIKVIDMKGGDA